MRLVWLNLEALPALPGRPSESFLAAPFEVGSGVAAARDFAGAGSSAARLRSSRLPVRRERLPIMLCSEDGGGFVTSPWNRETSDSSVRTAPAFFTACENCRYATSRREALAG